MNEEDLAIDCAFNCNQLNFKSPISDGIQTSCEEDIHHHLTKTDDNLMTFEVKVGDILQGNNHELGEHIDLLQEKGDKTVENLEEDRYQLKISLFEQNSKQDSCIHQFHQEVARLSEQLQSVKLSTRTCGQVAESTYENFEAQNTYMHREIDKLKIFNKSLSHQVDRLSSRCDEESAKPMQVKSVSVNSNGYDNVSQDVLKTSLKRLVDDVLEESTNEIVMKGMLSILESEMYDLREQVKICKEHLCEMKKKNEDLEQQLEELFLMQSLHRKGAPRPKVSLFDELAESLIIPEVDMNCLVRSDPRNDVRAVSNDQHSVESELSELYKKLIVLKNSLFERNDVVDINTKVSVDMVVRIVDELLEFPSEKRLFSQKSERFQKQLNGLHDGLKKTELSTTDKNYEIMRDTKHELTVKINTKEREILNLQKEKEILLESGTVDERIRKALIDRNEALNNENAARIKYETVLNDMKKLNSQLVKVVKENHHLSDDVEMWQLASLIDRKAGKKRQQAHSQRRASIAQLFEFRSSNR